jgi:hypothetical protein
LLVVSTHGRLLVDNHALGPARTDVGKEEAFPEGPRGTSVISFLTMDPEVIKAIKLAAMEDDTSARSD